MEEVGRLAMTVVVFESPRRLGPLLLEWVERGYGERRCVICRELTKLHEETRHGTVESLADYYSGVDVRGEVTIVLEGRSGDSAREREAQRDEALGLAQSMAIEGSTTREIAQRLRGEFGMTRNEAYELALAAEGTR
jgi:16S rRNA (cytidine1402-2'-O)-methyltransferase